jgi:hypothetical protein
MDVRAAARVQIKSSSCLRLKECRLLGMEAMNRHLGVAACLVLFLEAGCAGVGGGRGAAAAGETAATSADVSFLEADRDRDARITPGEFKAWLQTDAGTLERFHAADINRDGVLTLDEWQAVVRRPSAAAGASTRE